MLENLSKKFFFFVIIFSPLAFGTVEPWSYAVMEISAASGFLLYFIHIYKTDALLYKVPGLLPLLLFLAYILIQIIPLPAQIIRIISPVSYGIQNNALAMTISIHPRATFLEFLRYSTYVLFYILSVQLLTHKIMLKKTVLIITVFGSVLAFSSILQLYLTDNLALWFRHTPENAAVMGPYINRNHYAGLMEMIFPITLALFLFHRPRIDDKGTLAAILEILKQEKANIHILIGTGALLIIISIFISLSRGGMISTGAGLIFFLLISLKKKTSKKNLTLIMTLIVVAGLSIAWFGWGPINNRFVKLEAPEGGIYLARFKYWKDSEKIIRDFPVTGSGFGTFADIYRSYQTVDGKNLLEHAHNDYIELAIEGGLPGIILIFSFLFIFFRETYKSFTTRKDAYAIYLYLGSITGMICILLHSLSDFNFHVGANGLWFALSAALAVSASNTRIRVKNVATNLSTVKSRKAGQILPAGAGIIFFLIVLCNISILLAQFYYSHIKKMKISFTTPVEQLEKIEKITRRASWFDPLNAEYIYRLANISWFLHKYDKAEEYYLESISLNPANGSHAKRFGLFLARNNKAAAEKVLKQSVKLDIASADNALQYGGLLLNLGRKEQGIKYLKKAVHLDKNMISPVLTTMIASGLSLKEMEHAIPENPESEILFTVFLDQIGETVKAEKRYLKILASLKSGEQIREIDIIRIFRFFMDQGNLFQATKVLKKGETLLPLSATIRIRLGDLYRKQGILFKAREKYEEALLLNPRSRGAKSRLKMFNQ